MRPPRLSRRPERTARSATVAALATLLVGCVLVVDPPGGAAEHCAFRGRDTLCGECLAQRCEAAVDACCDDAWCGGLMSLVEGCAVEGDERCARARASTAREGQDLVRCLEGPCRGACQATSGTSSSRCGDTRFGFGQACACSPATPQLPANTYRCDRQVFPSTRCCAPQSWPSIGTTCACLAVSCSPVRDGCSCFLTDTFDPSASTECRGDVCCRDAKGCRCGSQACSSSEEAVASCGIDTMVCGPQTVTVESCSLP